MGDKWSIGPVPLVTSSLTPTNALPLSDWNVTGQPCLAIHTFIKLSHVSSADAVMRGAASAYFVK